jgi:transcriptional regulator with XRE-family HTH domain
MKAVKTNSLLELIHKKGINEGISTETIAQKLGISPSYLSQLSTGTKRTSGVSNSFLRNSGYYLGLPPVLCFLLAEKLDITDFFEPRKDFHAHIQTALEVIADSRVAFESNVDSESLKNLAVEVQLLIVLLYEKAFELELLPNRVTRSQLNAAVGPYIPFEITEE